MGKIEGEGTNGGGGIPVNLIFQVIHCVFTFQDPHGELVSQNVLIVRGSLQDTANHFSLDLSVTERALSKSRQILHDQRQKRPRPHLDDKMLTAWNGKEQECQYYIHKRKMSAFWLVNSEKSRANFLHNTSVSQIYVTNT